MSAYNYNITLSDTDKTTLRFSKINERLIIVNPVHSDFEKKDTTGNIIQINYNNYYDIVVNKTITLKEKHKYKILSITRHDSNYRSGPGYYLYIQKRITRSTLFIMPFLGGQQGHYRYNGEFINCFIGTEEDSDYGNNIYLLYRYNGANDYAQFEDDLINHELYEETIEVDKFQTLYKFKLPQDKEEDIAKLVNGKYSQISKESKERILKFNNAKKDGELEQILYKSEERRLQLEKEYDCNIPLDNELYSRFNVEEEIFMNYYIIE